jgi:hypothetical protein
VFTVTDGPAVISNGVLTFTTSGEVTITATQAGHANYLSAVQIGRTFSVTKAVASLLEAGLLEESAVARDEAAAGRSWLQCEAELARWL